MVLARADTELVLIDGRVLAGVSVEREGGEYVLNQADGTTITIPLELVETVRLVTKRDSEAGGRPADPRPGFRAAGPEQIGGSPPPGPTGIQTAEPRQVGGSAVALPSRSEQTAALGGPAQFRPDIVDSRWEPGTDWNMDPATQNNFAPSRWARDIVDSDWAPTSAFDADKDAMEASRSTWRKSIIDSSWAPTDGFKGGAGNQRE